MSGRQLLERLYNEILDQNPTDKVLWEMMVQKLNLDLDVDISRIKDVNTEGGLIIIANHPFGVVDGIVLGYLTSLMTEDFKFLVNSVLCREKRLEKFLLPIDFGDTKEARQTNINTRKEAIENLSKGVPIVIFPGGGVSTSPNVWKRAEDLDWKRFVIKLIKKSGAKVLPIYFHGQNSWLFQFVSQFSLDLRLGLMLNEVHNKMGKQIHIRLGQQIHKQEISGMEPEEALQFLRKRVYEMSDEFSLN